MSRTRTQEMAARDQEWGALYRQGLTLQQIGVRYGVSRERVRQCIGRIGVTRDGGGQAVLAKRNEVARLARRQRALNAKAFKLYDCSWDEAVAIVGQAPRSHGKLPSASYYNQKRNAKKRGIEWAMTFPEWWKVWQDSGHWQERGRGQGYCMARYLDTGPYAVGNVYICTIGQNFSDSYLKTPWDKRFPNARKHPGGQGLSKFEQDVVALFSQGMKRRQIAEQLGRPEGSVCWAMWHAKKLAQVAA
jgi:DNA-binding CsgD family transcriptional regulator